MIKHYLKVAVRNLLKYKTQNLISIVGLAVGLFCFCCCFYISRFVGSVDKCFENHERIVEIYQTTPEGRSFSGISGKMLPDLRQYNWEGVEDFTILSKPLSREYNAIQDNDETLPYQLTMMEADSLYYKVFTPTIIAGSWEQVAHNKNSIVLTEHTAKRMYDDIHQAIGKQIIQPSKQFSRGSVTYTVQAVIEDLPENTSMNFMETVDALTVNDEDGYESLPDQNFLLHHIYAFLQKGHTSEKLSQSFKNAEYTFQLFNERHPVYAKPLGKDFNQAQMANYMGLITCLVGLLILLAASLIFFHFQTGSFLNRGHEFSIRKVLGNTTSGLFFMQFIQIALVILGATLIACCLIELTSPLLHISLFNFSIQMPKAELLKHLMQYMGILLAITALVAFGIALYIRTSTIHSSLHGYGKANGKKHFRNILLGVQFFICWLFISMAAGLYLQAEKTSSSMFDTLTRQEKKDILRVALNYGFLHPEEREIIINNIRQHPGIKDIMFSRDSFYANSVMILFESENAEKPFITRDLGTTENFAEFMNVKMEGKFPQTRNEILVGRNFASRFEENMIGKVLYLDRKRGVTITGILDNINNYVYADGYGTDGYGNIYTIIEPASEGRFAFIKCYPEKTEEVKEWIDLKLRELLPSSIDPEILSLQDCIKKSQDLENSLKGIILSFSFVCLIITLLGVYSAITLDTERRQKEVAIRKVNGAGLKDIIILFARLYLWILGISATFAFPIVYLVLQQWKQMYLVFFNDGILYWGGILFGVTAITALTVTFRILKIARINPATIIKSE